MPAPSLKEALSGYGMESGRAEQMAGNSLMRDEVMRFIMQHMMAQNKPAPFNPFNSYRGAPPEIKYPKSF